MPAADLFSRFPTKFRASTERSSTWYVRFPGFFAVHDPVPASIVSSVAFVLNEGAIAVCRGEPDVATLPATRTTITPVYAPESAGPPAVPTGRVFVRFAENVPVDDRRDDLARAGYTVIQTLSYAPHAAWVRARDGDIAASLAGIAALEALPDVVNVEPQMLMKSQRR